MKLDLPAFGRKQDLSGVDIELTQPIGGGHYRVSDTVAGRLAKDAGRPLPPYGFHLTVEVNGKKMRLVRTQVSTDAYGFKPPQRGWVWAVF